MKKFVLFGIIFGGLVTSTVQADEIFSYNYDPFVSDSNTGLVITGVGSFDIPDGSTVVTTPDAFSVVLNFNTSGCIVGCVGELSYTETYNLASLKSFFFDTSNPSSLTFSAAYPAYNDNFVVNNLQEGVLGGWSDYNTAWGPLNNFIDPESAVPETSTFWLFAFGLMLAGLFTKRYAKQT